MTPSIRLTLCSLGLAATALLGVSASAASSLPTLPPGKVPRTTKQIPTPRKPLRHGLASRAAVTPRTLFAKNVSLDVLRPVRIEGSSNRLLMDKHTQLILRFDAASNTRYELECRFTGNPQVHIMEFADKKIVRQSRSNPASGAITHTIFPKSGRRAMKIFLQPTKDTDWSKCTVSPR